MELKKSYLSASLHQSHLLPFSQLMCSYLSVTLLFLLPFLKDILPEATERLKCIPRKIPGFRFLPCRDLHSINCFKGDLFKLNSYNLIGNAHVSKKTKVYHGDQDILVWHLCLFVHLYICPFVICPFIHLSFWTFVLFPSTLLVFFVLLPLSYTLYTVQYTLYTTN